MQVYCIFSVYGEGDSYSTFDLIGVSDTVDGGHKFIARQLTGREHNGNYVHKSMTKENNYTYLGKRSDCDNYCGYASFGGYVIEPMTLV
jgi:hypothetical protein